MKVFSNYAQYYDLLYQDKDYKKETEYVQQLIQRFAPKTASVLELGCGTGKHAALLAEYGFSVHGVDMSTEMLAKAKERLSSLPEKISAKLKFFQGNICEIRFNEQFDAVIALFHVVSYQTSNTALQKTFENVRYHLNPDGVFIFDVWYGPAVLSEPPVVKVKRFENKKVEVTRIAEPEIFYNQNIVDVNYHIFVQNKNNLLVEQIHEKHKMRYLFLPELEKYFETTGLKFIHFEEWLTGKKPDKDTWGVCFVSKNVDNGE
jgi:SAM-dependent methyltransferase